jgi:hypothetical protein
LVETGQPLADVSRLPLGWLQFEPFHQLSEAPTLSNPALRGFKGQP